MFAGSGPENFGISVIFFCVFVALKYQPFLESLSFILTCTNVTGYRYILHLYCLAVQAGFYSDVVECRTLSPADRVRSPVVEKCYFHFFTCYIWRPP